MLISIELESLLRLHLSFFTFSLLFLAFIVHLAILMLTRGKDRWLWSISRFVPIITIEGVALCQLVYDRKMFALHGTVHSGSVFPWLGFMILVGYLAAWYVYAVILEREQKKAGKV